MEIQVKGFYSIHEDPINHMAVSIKVVCIYTCTYKMLKKFSVMSHESQTNCKYTKNKKMRGDVWMWVKSELVSLCKDIFYSLIVLFILWFIYSSGIILHFPWFNNHTYSSAPILEAIHPCVGKDKLYKNIFYFILLSLFFLLLSCKSPCMCKTTQVYIKILFIHLFIINYKC